ncbi:unnamed protein product, partial [Mesorhabditis spiculigera]
MRKHENLTNDLFQNNYPQGIQFDASTPVNEGFVGDTEASYTGQPDDDDVASTVSASYYIEPRFTPGPQPPAAPPQEIVGRFLDSLANQFYHF